jgi:hypothetical protein
MGIVLNGISRVSGKSSTMGHISVYGVTWLFNHGQVDSSSLLRATIKLDAD